MNFNWDSNQILPVSKMDQVSFRRYYDQEIWGNKKLILLYKWMGQTYLIMAYWKWPWSKDMELSMSSTYIVRANIYCDPLSNHPPKKTHFLYDMWITRRVLRDKCCLNYNQTLRLSSQLEVLVCPESGFNSCSQYSSERPISRVPFFVSYRNLYFQYERNIHRFPDGVGPNG